MFGLRKTAVPGRMRLGRRLTGCYFLFALTMVCCTAAGAAQQPLAYALLAMVAAMLVLTGGAMCLSRMLRPMANLEGQLSRAALAASVEEVELQTTTGRTAAVVGWNRLVDYVQRLRRRGSFEERLARAIGGNAPAEEMLQNLSDGIALTNEQGAILFANQALAALVGPNQFLDQPSQQLCGKRIAEIFPAGDDSCWKTSYGELFGSLVVGRPVEPTSPLERPVVGELEMNNPQGARILRIARRRMLSQPGNSSRRVLWTVRDITQQKLAERIRNQFLDAATHELRTPLANIKAYAETLALSDAADLEQQKEFYNVINTEATRLGRFVDDLLDLSSLEIGSLVVDRQPVELDRLLKEVIMKTRPLMEQNNLDFVTVLPPKFPKIALDKDKIAASLVNLLGNAAKYTPAGGRVTFKTRWEREREEVIVEVEDTGVGVTKEELPKIFDKFFRGSDERVRQQAGSGLGLSLAKEVVQLHGGKLEATSEADKGSTFTMTLPL